MAGSEVFSGCDFAGVCGLGGGEFQSFEAGGGLVDHCGGAVWVVDDVRGEDGGEGSGDGVDE